MPINVSENIEYTLVVVILASYVCFFPLASELKTKTEPKLLHASSG